MATKKQILESDELLQQKRKAYHLSDEGFEEYKKFLSDPDQKKFCFKGYYYVEVKEQDDAHWRIIPIYPYTTFIATTMIKITSIGNQIRG